MPFYFCLPVTELAHGFLELWAKLLIKAKAELLHNLICYLINLFIFYEEIYVVLEYLFPQDK